jgi:hypothetical protein
MKTSIQFESGIGEANTMPTSDLTRYEWTLHLTQYACERTLVGPGIYELNAKQNAPTYGGLYALIPSPSDATTCRFSCEVKLPEGVASSTPVAAVIYNWNYTVSLVTPTAQWQPLEVSFPVAGPGTDHQISILTNHSYVGSGPQARCLVRRARAWYEGGDGMLAMPFRLFDISAPPLFHGIPNDDPTALGPRPGSQGRAIFVTDATKIGIKWYSTIKSMFPQQAPLVVRVNRSQVIVLDPPQDGKMLLSEVSLPGVPGTLVEIFNGIQGDQPLITGQPSAPVGTWFHSLYVPEQASIAFLRPRPKRRVLAIGASIVSGWFSSPPQINSWTARLRDMLGPDFDVALDAWGWRPLHAIAKDAATMATYIDRLKASGYDPTDVIIHLQINDYGLNESPPGVWSASSYGAGYAAFLDALHAAFPDARLWCPSAELRASESTPNQWGNVLEDYRVAGKLAADARAPWAIPVDGKSFLSSTDITIDGLHPDPKAQSKAARRWIELLTAMCDR